MNSPSRRNAALLLLFATASWGSLFHVGKAVVERMDPWWFTLVRYIGAAAVLSLALGLGKGLRWRMLVTNARALAFYGTAGFGFFSIVVFTGLQMTAASHGAVVMATMPVTTLLARALVDRKAPPAWALGIAAFALSGVVVISGALTGSSAGASWHGDALVLLGTLGWVTYTLGGSRVPGVTAAEYTAFTVLLALPAMAAAALLATLAGIAHLPSADTLQHAALPLAYLVLVPTVAAALAFNRGIREMGAANGIVFINVVPVSAMLIGLARGMHPGVTELAGAALVMAALLRQHRQASRAAA